MLDHMTGGRANAGFARGYQRRWVDVMAQQMHGIHGALPHQHDEIDAEQRILHALHAAPRSASPAQLARDLAMSLGALQAYLAQLHAAGYVAPRSPLVPLYSLTAQGRALFVRAQAPHRALTSNAVTTVVAAAGRRAGLGLVGAHRLRHSAATAILRAGGSLGEIGQLLRHARALTTVIYAKVDRDALRLLARPWPGESA